MDFDHAVAAIIDRARNELAELAAKAALERDFRQAAHLATLAQRITEAANQSQGQAQNRATDIPRTDAYNSNTYTSNTTTVDRTRPRSMTRSTSLPRSGRAGYPRFHREGDVLVKIGWSKSDRRPYEHRSPFAVVEQLVAEIIKVGKGGARFTTEQLLPLKGTDGVEWPSYQVYLCLAWLVFEGLLDRYGRQGYTVKATNFPEAVHSKWNSLSIG